MLVFKNLGTVKSATQSDKLTLAGYIAGDICGNFYLRSCINPKLGTNITLWSVIQDIR